MLQVERWSCGVECMARYVTWCAVAASVQPCGWFPSLCTACRHMCLAGNVSCTSLVAGAHACVCTPPAGPWLLSVVGQQTTRLGVAPGVGQEGRGHLHGRSCICRLYSCSRGVCCRLAPLAVLTCTAASLMSGCLLSMLLLPQHAGCITFSVCPSERCFLLLMCRHECVGLAAVSCATFRGRYLRWEWCGSVCCML